MSEYTRPSESVTVNTTKLDETNVLRIFLNNRRESFKISSTVHSEEKQRSNGLERQESTDP